MVSFQRRELVALLEQGCLQPEYKPNPASKGTFAEGSVRTCTQSIGLLRRFVERSRLTAQSQGKLKGLDISNE